MGKVIVLDDYELVLDYMQHREDDLKPEYVKTCKANGLDPENEDSALLVKCLWSDYLLLQKSPRSSGPYARIADYLLKTEKKDFLNQNPEARKGLTPNQERELLKTSSHIFAVVVRSFHGTLFEYGVKKKKPSLDLQKLKATIEKSGFLQEEKPDDSIVFIAVLGGEEREKETLVIDLEWDLGPTGTSNIFSIHVDENGHLTPKKGPGFEGNDSEDSAYIEKCCRSVWHKVNSVVRKSAS